jgi:hypothetical protein
MYSLWKTRGATISPWRSDVILGAQKADNETWFVLTAAKEWEGRLLFDAQRHKTNMGLPIDYPRINQFPEWFTVQKEKQYTITSSNKKIAGKYKGEDLLKGIQVKLEEGEQLIVSVK